MRPTATATRARLVCFLVCLSLLAQALLPVPAGASGGGADKSRPTAERPSAGQEVEAADLPDLDEARSRPRHEPKAVPPVPSTRRRCPPRNPRCNDTDGGVPRPAPTPAPQPSPRGHGNPPHGLASASATSFTSVVGAAFGGRAPLLDLSLLDFYSGGGYSVSDAPARLSPAAVYAAAPVPATPYQAQQGRVNVAAAANGGAAAASSTYTLSGSYPASAAIDGDRRGLNWGSGGGWNDANANTYPDWLEVSFSGVKTIDEVDVFTLQDDYANPSEPTEGMTFGLYGLTDYAVEYWTGSAWAQVPGGSVSGNDKVWRKFTFTPLTTSKVRVVVNVALSSYSRVVEVEAYEAQRVNHALASNGATATASSTYTAAGSYPAAAVINGDRRGMGWGSGGGWNDATESSPDWLEVAFAGARQVDEVDVFTLQDAYASPSEPTESMTFSQYGVTAFEVQYWAGTAWATVPGGNVSGNNKVWRKVTFPAVTTEKVRVVVNNSLASYSRLTEVEAWGAGPSLPPGTGLKGEYYNGDNFDSYVLTRADSTVDFDWGSGSPHPSVNADFFSARWTGTVVPRYTEGYTFYTTSDDGVRVWIDGRLVIDKWLDQAPTEWSNGPPVALEAGHAYTIKVEFYEHWGGATARLSWSSASQAKEVVPQSRLYGCCAAPADGGAGHNFAAARLDPVNRTGGGGVDPYSRNFNFQIPLVSLAGRAGLDLGLTLSYNSLVWTKDAGGVTFDADRGFPSPGFRLGFPVVEQKFYNPQTQKYAYLLVTPGGARVELRQTTTPGLYESADSSYLQLTEADMTLRSTDGTQLTLVPLGGSYRCNQVKDRNGNYLTVAYHDDGRVDRVTDTLGRVVVFDYDGNLNLKRIRQPWKRELEGGSASEGEHEWATFGYEDLTLRPQFSNLAVIGEQPGAVIPVVRWVGLADGSYYSFEYNGWGQVWKVTRHAATAVDAQLRPTFADPLTSTWIDLPGAGASLGGATAVTAGPQGDCPRFTKERVWVEHGVMGQSAEVTTSYDEWAPNMASCEVVAPDGKVKTVETYATSGWQRGMTTQSSVLALKAVDETTSVWETKKTTSVTLEHDGVEGSPYPTNPRVTQTTISDPQGNTRTTKVTYTKPEDFRGTDSGYYDTLNVSLPKKVEECADSNCSDVRRTTVTDYRVPNLGQYIARRILGLASYRMLYDGAASDANLRSKVGYVYDDIGHVDGVTSQPKFLQGLPSPAWQHSGDDYGTVLRWRGNVTRLRRYEVSQQDGGESGAFTESLAGYNVAGAAVFAQDASGHRTTVSYEDAFYAEVNRTHPDPASRLKTYAYPTAVTDPDGFTAWSWYNYDMGVATKARSQKPNTTANGTDGPVATTFYDGAGRAVMTTNSVNAAHTEWVYEPSMTVVRRFTTVSDESAQNPALRLYSVAVLDGAGRVRATAGDFPGSTTATPAGNYSAQLTYYDAMGRAVFRSNPTEMRIVDGAWTPAGDDANGGLWKGTTQTYDWKGRPLTRTNTDGTTVEYKYGGCGCAGGEVVTARDEVGRRQRVTYDPLGRVKKTQLLTIQPKDQELSEGGDAAVYSTTTNAYDALDHILQVTEQAGVSGASQVTTMSYDGFGRLSTRHLPAQDADRSTAWSYYGDGAVKTVTDARGVKVTYGYNGRHLVTSVQYDTSNTLPGQNVAQASNVTLKYDAAGNRTEMKDGFGTATYNYDTLSRLSSESRAFSDPDDASVGFTKGFSYGYNLAGELTSLTDPDGLQFLYGYDRAGQLRNVTGATAYGNVTDYAHDMQYRAWGALKAMSYGNGRSLSAAYNARMQVESFQVPGLMGSQYRYTTAVGGSDNDGRVKFVQDLTQANSPFDRSYEYDLAGRLELAKTGAGARGPFQSNGPYHESFDYDVWGNTTSRTGKHWIFQTMTPHTATYVNDRATTGVTYDADGRTRVTGTLEDTYDAAGLLASAHDAAAREQFAAGLTVTQGHDGDGQRVRHAENGYRTYYVRSSVLGEVAAEYNAAGQWQRGYVFGPGLGQVATRAFATGQYVEWMHTDPVTGSRRRTNSAGAEVAEATEELDPLGVDTGRCNPYFGGCGSLEDFGGKGGLLSQSRYGNASDRRAGCSIQGMAVMCDLLVALISSGAAQECPDGDCGPRAGEDGKLHPLRTNPDTGELGYWEEKRGEDPPDGTWTDPETKEVWPTTGTNTDRSWVALAPWASPGTVFPEMADLGGGIPKPQEPNWVRKEREQRRIASEIYNCVHDKIKDGWQKKEQVRKENEYTINPGEGATYTAIATGIIGLVAGKSPLTAAAAATGGLALGVGFENVARARRRFSGYQSVDQWVSAEVAKCYTDRGQRPNPLVMNTISFGDWNAIP